MSWTIRHGKSELLLPGLEPDSIDSCVTDPPYELSDGSKASPARVLAKALLPKDAHLIAEGPSGCVLHELTIEIARLCGVRGLVPPPVAMPVIPVALDEQLPGRQGKIEDACPPTPLPPYRDRWHYRKAETAVYLGGFALKGAPAEALVDAAHRTGAGFFAGGIGIGFGITSPSGPSFEASLASVAGGHHNVRLIHDAAATLIRARPGAEYQAVARLALAGPILEHLTAGAALTLLALITGAGAQLVRASTGTSSLTPTAQR